MRYKPLPRDVESTVSTRSIGLNWTRSSLAAFLRSVRNQHGRRDARECLDRVIWIGGYPIRENTR